MTDTKTLEQKIHDSGLTKKAILNKIGIKSYATLRAKIKTDREFTASEMDKLCDVLNINKSQRGSIFFAKAAE